MLGAERRRCGVVPARPRRPDRRSAVRGAAASDRRHCRQRARERTEEREGGRDVRAADADDRRSDGARQQRHPVVVGGTDRRRSNA